MQVFNKIKDFVQGQLALSELQSYFLQDAEAQSALRNLPLMSPYSNRLRDGFDYLIALNPKSIEDCLHAQDMLSCLLAKSNIKYSATDKYEKMHQIKTLAQPKWAEIDEVMMQNILDSYDRSLRKSFIKHAKLTIEEKYRNSSKPPKWLQAPQWPISAEGVPLLFIEQKKLKSEQEISCSYCFLDETTGEYTTITQSITVQP